MQTPNRWIQLLSAFRQLAKQASLEPIRFQGYR